MDLYLDCNATTPLASEVFEAMQPFWMERMGNPSSRHSYGRVARDAVERARGEVAKLLNVSAKQVIFTGSGTEGNNLVMAKRNLSLKMKLKRWKIKNECVS